MISGQHHRIGGQYLGAYAIHTAWLEDHPDQLPPTLRTHRG
jgi:hypothetical protein